MSEEKIMSRLFVMSKYGSFSLFLPDEACKYIADCFYNKSSLVFSEEDGWNTCIKFADVICVAVQPMITPEVDHRMNIEERQTSAMERQINQWERESEQGEEWKHEGDE